MSLSSASRASRKVATIVIAGALAFGVAACGDDEEEGSESSEATTEEATTEETASAEEVTVEATEYDFELSATPTAETKSITFDNQGEKFHVMVWAQIAEGVTIEEAIAAEGEEGTATLVAEAEAAPGKSVTVDVKKAPEPGPYVMLCPIEDEDGAHYDLGQLEEFDIE